MAEKISLVNLNLKIDKQLKEQFANVCKELGLPMSMAITIFCKTVVRENRIPFEIKADS